MTKHFISILLLSIVAFFLSVFTINENEYGVVTSKASTRVYTTGIHWQIPFYDKLIVVYKSQFNSEISTPIELSDYAVNIAYNWHVIDPIKYVQFTETNQQPYQKISGDILNSFNRESNLLNLQISLNQQQNIKFESYGILVDNVYIATITNNQNIAKDSTQNQSIIKHYSKAMQIKQNVAMKIESAQQKMLQTSPQFYKLYSYIESLQLTVKNKEQLESMDSILRAAK